MKRFGYIACALAAYVVAALCSPVIAQNFTLPPNSVISGHVSTSGALPPTLTGGTLASGSTDVAGFFTASAASGTLVFGTVWNAAPSCVVVDASATPIAVYLTTTAQITLTTITSAHLYHYSCFGKTGG